MAILWNFIEKFEAGKHPLKGTVPICTVKSTLNEKSWCFGKEVNSVIQNSGVTVGAGIDLGQNVNLYSQLSPTTYAKVKPYIGKRKIEAVNSLSENPLYLNDVQLYEIQRLVQKDLLRNFVRKFNRHSSTKFESLPDEIQTVIFSHVYQHGNSEKKYLKLAYSGEWMKLGDMLKSDHKYGSRSEETLKLLEIGVNKLKGFYHYTLKANISSIIAAGIYSDHPYFTTTEYFNSIEAGQSLGVMPHNIDCALKFIDDGFFQMVSDVPTTNRFIGGGKQFQHPQRIKPVAVRLISDRTWKVLSEI